MNADVLPSFGQDREYKSEAWEKGYTFYSRIHLMYLSIIWVYDLPVRYLA